jgi:hypothetical protein
MDAIGPVFYDHNYSLAADYSSAPTTPTVHPPFDQSTEDAAGDPEVENLEYTGGVLSVRSTTPAAAWILTTLLLLSVLQRTHSANIIGEIAADLAQVIKKVFPHEYMFIRTNMYDAVCNSHLFRKSTNYYLSKVGKLISLIRLLIHTCIYRNM